MNKPIPKELISELEKLDVDDQVRVLNYVQSLNSKPSLANPGSVMRKFVGKIPREDLDLMKQAIDTDCSQIDHASWQ